MDLPRATKAPLPDLLRFAIKRIFCKHSNSEQEPRPLRLRAGHVAAEYLFSEPDKTGQDNKHLGNNHCQLSDNGGGIRYLDKQQAS